MFELLYGHYPSLQILELPRGIPGLSESMQEKVKLGNTFADWIAKLVGICLDVGVHFWVENPAGSWLWKQRRWRRLRALEAVEVLGWLSR